MSNLIPGNQKHLTLDNRIYIEKSLDNKVSYKEIAKVLCKDPTTISKEVWKHRSFKERNNFASYNKCIHRRKCSLTNVCKRPVPCKKQCALCNACNNRCKKYQEETCVTTLRAPYVCNGCYKKAQCRMDKYFYKAVTANRRYRSILAESRNGINITENDLIRLDETISPLILNGQTPYEILEAHPEISQSVKTIYNYIGNGALSVKNLDLPRKVKYKLRKTHKSQIKDTGIFEGRIYTDFLSYMQDYPDSNVVEMDTVVGREGSHKVFLTLYFRNCRCMLIYLLPDKTSSSVKGVFDSLERKLTTQGFLKAFPVILTDRGSEFSNPDSLEIGTGNTIRTRIYYCNPMASWQKGGLEKNHQFIRYVLPKGSSFDNLTQCDATKLACHINSTARASLNGQSPFKLATLLLGNDAVRAFGLSRIASDSIILTPKLLKG